MGGRGGGRNGRRDLQSSHAPRLDMSRCDEGVWLNLYLDPG